LIGEAAHVFPPIGAQGLNLSLRDIQSAVDLALQARAAQKPLAVGDAYDRARRADVLSRTAGIDLLNRSLLSGFLPVQMLRAAGLQLLASVPPLRHLLMQEGVAPGRALRKFPNFLREKISRQRA
jgi:2-octaprenyl-6-methoxyphenol hydroxylase